MRQEVACWLHTLAAAGERVNSWVLAGWVRVAAGVAADGSVSSFTALSVEEWVAAARRRYHDRHRRLPPPSYLHNHRATIARLHAALTLACQGGQPWWRCPVWDPRHGRRIPVREHEPLEGQRLNFARVSPAWLREAIQWYFAAGLSTGLLSWSSLPSFLTYLGRHFAAFLAAEGIGTPDLGADPEAGIRPVALRLAAWLRQQRTRSGRPLAPPTVGLIQTTVSGFYAFMADRRADAAREPGEPRRAVLTDAHARWWRPGEIAGRYRGPAGGNYIDAAALSRIAGHVEILGLPRDRAKTVVMNGTPRRIRGLGDEQAMRAFLLAIATGRRINEILMMDFAPLSPVPGLDTRQAAETGGPAARLRYQQTKIAGAPQAILVGADVVAIVAEQQDFARALVRAGDPAAADPPYLFLAWQANTTGARHYRANTLNGLLTQLAAALQVTDATGALVDFQRTHRMRHTKATDLLNAGVPIHVVQRYMGHYAGDLVKLIMLGDCLVEAGQESVEDFLPPGLALVGGVVALLLEGGAELDGGLEEGAGFADRLEVAVQADGPGAVAVAEHALVHFGAELAHLGALGAGGQVLRGVVEGLDLLGYGEVLLGHGAVGDAGIHHGHPHRSMSQKGGYRLEAHAPVDGLGGQRVPEPVRADVADPGGLGGFGDGPVDAALADALAVLGEEVRGAQAGGPCGEPAVQEVFELGVQRDIAVGAELAERHVEPVGGADLHDGVDGEVEELAFAQAGAGQEFHGQADERVGVGAGGLQQLGERAVVQEPGQRLVAQRQVAGEHQDRRRDVAAVPFGQPLEAGAQRAEVLGEADPRQFPAAGRWPGGQVQFVGLDMGSAQVGDAAASHRQ